MASDSSPVWRESTVRMRYGRVAFLCLLSVVAVKLVLIQGLRHEQYKELSLQFARQSMELHARRGTVTDRIGRELAVDRPAIAVYVHPDQLQDIRGTADRLGEILDLPGDEITERILDCPEAFMYVDRQVDASLKPQIVALTADEPKGVGTEPATRRVYPKGALAADLLGFTGTDHDGLWGLEAAYDYRLTGTPGLAVGERDATGWPIPHRTTTMEPARDGESLRLTLDVRVQEACERELAEGLEESGAEAGCVIVMDAYNGDVLAACDGPSFDPNDWHGVASELWTPRFSTWIYEPGSTIKPLVVAMALSEEVVAPSQTFQCSGSIHVDRWDLECRHAPGGHGTVDLGDLLKYSCNVSAAQVGITAGPERMAQLFRDLGFTEVPTTELPSERHDLPGYLDPAWTATSSYGQGIGITPLHLAAAFCALANEGMMMKPRFVKATVDADGHANEFPPIEKRRVYPRHAANRVLGMMTKVVEDEDGTGHLAKVPGCPIAGKTGTAEIAVDGSYGPGKYVVSFAGIFPADEPRYVAVVVMDRPKGDNAYGGRWAAPVFRDIAESLITDLRLPVERPTAPIEEASSTQ